MTHRRKAAAAAAQKNDSGASTISSAVNVPNPTEPSSSGFSMVDDSSSTSIGNRRLSGNR